MNGTSPGGAGRVWKVLLLLATAAAAVGVAAWLRPIAQNPAYHRFADQRALLGVPHALNVLSNVPFLIVGAWGLATVLGRRPRFAWPWERWPWALFMASVFCTGLGSGYYHLAPDNATLLWDRLAMVVGFAALLAITLGERVDARAGALLAAPLVALGLWGLLAGHPADLRWYGLLQAGTVLLVVLALALFPARYTGTRAIFQAMALYLLASALEAGDGSIFRAGGIVSGHTLKHVAAALAAWRLGVMVRGRHVAGAGGHGPGDQPPSP
ncbi:MAG TPA: alkaline phytoceramidase [Polyangia bacterium]|jgi:hypothetical protein